MDSLNRAIELENLAKSLEFSIRQVKGVSSEGVPLARSSKRELVIKNVTEVATHPHSPHPCTMRLTAQYLGGDHKVVNLNNPIFLHALAEAITGKLPELVDEALEIIRAKGREAVKVAEAELESSTRKLAALRRSPELQQELI